MDCPSTKDIQRMDLPRECSICIWDIQAITTNCISEITLSSIRKWQRNTKNWNWGYGKSTSITEMVIQMPKPRLWRNILHKQKWYTAIGIDQFMMQKNYFPMQENVGKIWCTLSVVKPKIVSLQIGNSVCVIRQCCSLIIQFNQFLTWLIRTIKKLSFRWSD